jgi:hypothetical protein
MSTFSYESILERLDSILNYCRGPLNLARDVSESRFVTLRERLNELIIAVRAIKAGTATRSTMAAIEADLRLYTIALVEAHEIGATSDFVVARPRHQIQRTMRRILSGPLLPNDEDTASNQSRNTLFEIIVASTLARAGLAADLGEPDVRVLQQPGTVYIACKRIFSPRAIRPRIEDAGRQIVSRLSKDAGAIGVIAISLSRLLNSSRAAPQLPTVRRRSVTAGLG